jgi:hypothetical protein
MYNIQIKHVYRCHPATTDRSNITKLVALDSDLFTFEHLKRILYVQRCKTRPT